MLTGVNLKTSVTSEVDDGSEQNKYRSLGGERR